MTAQIEADIAAMEELAMRPAGSQPANNAARRVEAALIELGCTAEQITAAKQAAREAGGDQRAHAYRSLLANL